MLRWHRKDIRKVIATIVVAGLTTNVLWLWLMSQTPTQPGANLCDTSYINPPPDTVYRVFGDLIGPNFTMNPSSNLEASQLVYHEIAQNLNRKIKNLEEKNTNLITFLSKPVINKVNHSYIHNPVHACSESKTEVLFVVPSAVFKSGTRIDVRNSNLGQFVQNPDNNATLLFFLGHVFNDTKNLQAEVDEESRQFGDIVQESFLDVYSNIRLKALSMLYWAAEFCPQTTFVIRADDDVKVFPDKLVSVLRDKHKTYLNFIIGKRVENWKPYRNQNSKYYLSESEYPHSTLPPFALGGLLGYPICTVWLLYQAALRVRPVWLDDVYITGICAPEVGVPVLSDPDFVFRHWDL